MKCKSCGREIENNSIFCNWCGEKQIRERRKDEIRVPAPRQLPSGKWTIQLRAEGVSITETTADLCVTHAKAVRSGFIQQKKAAPRLTLETAMRNYIDAKDALLSPATVRNYESIARNRFTAHLKENTADLDWQVLLNEEAKAVSPKTLANAWGFIVPMLKYNKLPVPDVTLPQVVTKSLPWLDYKQIQTFLAAIHGKKCELPALFALHSLRRSEILALTPAKIDEKGIHITAARVLDKNGSLVEKDLAKTPTSIRTVPIMIPRLRELLDASETPKDQFFVPDEYFNKINERINTVCRRNNLPQVGLHGLRRSFASLAYHLRWPERQTMAVGGWKDYDTMHKIYIKLADFDLQEAAKTMQAFYQGAG